jgi:hypothetical protein
VSFSVALSCESDGYGSGFACIVIRVHRFQINTKLWELGLLLHLLKWSLSPWLLSKFSGTRIRSVSFRLTVLPFRCWTTDHAQPFRFWDASTSSWKKLGSFPATATFIGFAVAETDMPIVYVFYSLNCLPILEFTRRVKINPGKLQSSYHGFLTFERSAPGSPFGAWKEASGFLADAGGHRRPFVSLSYALLADTQLAIGDSRNVLLYDKAGGINLRSTDGKSWTHQKTALFKGLHVRSAGIGWDGMLW